MFSSFSRLRSFIPFSKPIPDNIKFIKSHFKEIKTKLENIVLDLENNKDIDSLSLQLSAKYILKISDYVCKTRKFPHFEELKDLVQSILQSQQSSVLIENEKAHWTILEVVYNNFFDILECILSNSSADVNEQLKCVIESQTNDDDDEGDDIVKFITSNFENIEAFLLIINEEMQNYIYTNEYQDIKKYVLFEISLLYILNICKSIHTTGKFPNFEELQFLDTSQLQLSQDSSLIETETKEWNILKAVYYDFLNIIFCIKGQYGHIENQSMCVAGIKNNIKVDIYDNKDEFIQKQLNTLFEMRLSDDTYFILKLFYNKYFKTPKLFRNNFIKIIEEYSNSKTANQHVINFGFMNNSEDTTDLRPLNKTLLNKETSYNEYMNKNFEFIKYLIMNTNKSLEEINTAINQDYTLYTNRPVLKLYKLQYNEGRLDRKYEWNKVFIGNNKHEYYEKLENAILENRTGEMYITSDTPDANRIFAFQIYDIFDKNAYVFETISYENKILTRMQNIYRLSYKDPGVIKVKYLNDVGEYLRNPTFDTIYNDLQANVKSTYLGSKQDIEYFGNRQYKTWR